jgi:2-polyprenyl-3-methyl-5-hydroxy-6-metoxy-1,4-benzoquinol methylase
MQVSEDAMPTKQDDLREWERLEIERSASEAEHTDTAALRANETQVARYLNPPPDTHYPLEYSYHLLGDVRGKRVLDFGCGSGENTILLARRGAKVLAMDISESLIHVAGQRLAVNGVDSSDVHFFATSAHDIALADESVDVVFGMAILHHLELPLVAREVKRVLRKGGRAIFQEPVRNSKFIKFVRNLIPYQAPDISPFERPLTDAELKDFATGFSDFRSRAFNLPYINLAEVLPGTERLIHPLYRLDGKLLKRFSSLGYYASVRVIEMVK